MKVFLIGYMGAGKTTLGKALAGKLKVPFIDMDAVLEQREGKSISRLFEELGEDGFRKKERNALQASVFPENFVMATGGGAPCFYDNMDWMNREGLTVYLRAQPEEIARRLEDQRQQRPLLRTVKKEDLAGFIGQRIAQREGFYMQAQIVLEGNDLTPQQLLDSLKKAGRK